MLGAEAPGPRRMRRARFFSSRSLDPGSVAPWARPSLGAPFGLLFDLRRAPHIMRRQSDEAGIPMDRTEAEKRLLDARLRIEKASQAAGLGERGASLVAVSKFHPAEAIRVFYDLGVRDFGENYAQELAEKCAVLPSDIRWHMIGNTQSNKAKIVARNAAWVHTLDSERLARRLSAARPSDLPDLNVLIEVNVSGESAKSGVRPQDALPLAWAARDLPKLRLRGLMCVGGLADKGKNAAEFRALRELFDQANAQGFAWDTLSMGMTGDMELAIANGSTMVRLGSALFGPRPAKAQAPAPTRG